MPIARELKKVLRLPERFRRRDFLARERLRGDYRVLAAALLDELDFASMLDVGCANGFLLSELSRAGKDVAGIEASAEVLEVLPAELRGVVRIGDFSAAEGRWDLVCCVELAEHIRPRRSEELVATLARAAGRWIFFTAAPPGQSGVGHINCRPRSEWLDMFASHGWSEERAKSEAIAARLAALEHAHWLRQNGVVLAPR